MTNIREVKERNVDIDSTYKLAQHRTTQNMRFRSSSYLLLTTPIFASGRPTGILYR